MGLALVQYMVVSSKLYHASSIKYMICTDSHCFTDAKKPLYPEGTAVEKAEKKV